ncbi:MAG: permease prefix domain 1-containing protein [Clostridia bacterium]|nr:permease prefix domain 1-containing protein [Clostridia bacterium]
MNEKLRQHMDLLFADAPQTVRMAELKEEILQNLCDKYNDLIAEGKTEEAAYNIAVASVGDVRALIRAACAGTIDAVNHEAYDRARRRQGILVAVAVALYIVAVVPCILLGNELGVVCMFLLAAVATGLLIYNNATKPRYIKQDDAVGEDFQAWKQDKADGRRLRGAFSGALWLVIVCAYFLVSFLTGAWHISWLIFLIGAALSLVLSGIFDLRE